MGRVSFLDDAGVAVRSCFEGLRYARAALREVHLRVVWWWQGSVAVHSKPPAVVLLLLGGI